MDEELLTGLDEVPWSRLGSAGGSDSSAVPQLIRGLVSPDAQTRTQSLRDCRWHICHQGTVYRATARAVPFLFRVAASTDVPDRAGIVDLLADIAGGSGYVQVHRSFMEMDRFDESAKLDAAEVRERREVKAARKAVLAGTDVLAKLLSDPEISVRRAAAYALAVLPERADLSTAAILDRWPEEQDATTRAGLLITLGVLAARTGNLGVLPAILPSTTNDVPVVRLAAASARFLADRSDEAALHQILDTVAEGEPGLRPLRGGPAILDWVIGDRLPARLQYCRTVARDTDAQIRWRAVCKAEELARGWRSITSDCVNFYAQASSDESDQVRSAAIIGMFSAYPLCQDYKDVLFDYVERQTEEFNPPPGSWTMRHYDPTWQTLVTLGRLGDQRLLPRLQAAVGASDPPGWVGEVLNAFGGSAVELLPEVIEMVDRLPAPEQTWDIRLVPTLEWIGKLGAPTPSSVERLEAFLPTKVGKTAAKALGELGPSAQQSVGGLRRVLQRTSDAYAAWALLRIDGDPAPLLEVARQEVGNRRVGARTVLGMVEELGPRASAIAPAIVRDLDTVNMWDRVAAARAYWRVTGNPEAVLPTLLEEATPSKCGIGAVEALGWLGPAARGAAPKLEAWLADDERHTQTGRTNDVIEYDELFRERCAEVLGLIKES